MTFVRNTIFLGFSVPAILTKPTNDKHLTPKWIAAMLVAMIACFICGLAMHKSFTLPRIGSFRMDSRAQTMQKLQAIYPFSADSTYMVYLFSFTCPHCQNSFANLQQYQQMHLADKVLGIAIENEEAQERFYRIYCPEIEIITVPNDTMAHITGNLPIGIYIVGDSILQVQSGVIISPGLSLP